MNGKGNVRFFELFESTVRTHGSEWAHNYYTSHGMQEWEWGFWFDKLWGQSMYWLANG